MRLFSLMTYSSTRRRTPRLIFLLIFARPGMSISTLKCPLLQTIAPSFISAEMLRPDHVLVAGQRDEHVADLGRLGHRHDLEAVHRRLERLDRIDFGDDDDGAHAAGPHGEAPAAPAVAGHDDLRAGQQVSPSPG